MEDEVKKQPEQLLATIEQAKQDLKNDGLFTAVIFEALSLGAVTSREFARKWGMSQSSVERWRTGLSVPHTALRPRVYRWLKEKFEAKSE
ncbi:MAG: hypothetical protein A3C13_04630 [Candidatus Lloydbacteria bacterium RIFCSPHIGHO2_02_FULL_50_11]|nr:MAG: hypothetical protein A3C13_04630 [Candidatus Lloydbacteria bacterium RIFCSPHIGHO2_02_FULL_50_11]